MSSGKPCSLAELKLEWASTMPFDTSPEAEAVQMDVFRRMTPSQRLELALQMSDSMRNVTLSGLRHRHPEMTEKELLRELMRVMYGFTPRP